MKIQKINKLFRDDVSFQRNTHLIAIAPNASSSATCPGDEPSPSVEPFTSNYFVRRSRSGATIVKNPILEKLLIELLDGDEDKIQKIWVKIDQAEGSVQKLDILSDRQKEIFKTAPEIDQRDLINSARARQQNVCQAMSLNLFFSETASWKYVLACHWLAFCKTGVGIRLKTLYYYRTSKSKSIGSKSIERDTGCVSCEG